MPSGDSPFSELLATPLARPRFQTFLLARFAGAALMLAAIGVYGVVAASVRQRYTEIGVRVALGATAGQVRTLVLGEGLKLPGIGVGIGLAGAFAATRVMRGMLYEVNPLDPIANVRSGVRAGQCGRCGLLCANTSRHAPRSSHNAKVELNSRFNLQSEPVRTATRIADIGA